MSLELIQITSTVLSAVIPAEGELVYAVDTKQLFIGDGVTVGGINLDSSGVEFANFEPRAAAIGPPGPPGPRGPAGPAGPVGPRGIAGLTGATGPTGLRGPAGAAGTTGPRGPAGPAGTAGFAGPRGPSGSQGVPGAQGVQGPQGLPGVTGPRGPAGPAGPAGSGGSSSSLTNDSKVVALGADGTTIFPGMLEFPTKDIGGGYNIPGNALVLSSKKPNSSGSTGQPAVITTEPGSASSPDSQNILIRGGVPYSNTSGAAGDILLYGSHAYAGGNIELAGGGGETGGNVIIKGGNGITDAAFSSLPNNDGIGGNVQLSAGRGNLIAGSVSITAGAAIAAPSVPSKAGNVSIRAGGSSNSTAGDCGNIILAAGLAAAIGRSGRVEINTSNSNIPGGKAQKWNFDETGVLTVPGSIIPDTNIAYDLGSANKRFKDIYLSSIKTLTAPITSATVVDVGTGYQTSGTSGTTGGSGTGLTVYYTYGRVGIGTVQVIDPGTGYQNGDVLTVSASDGNATIRLNIAPVTNTWTFGSDGITTIPGTLKLTNQYSASVRSIEALVLKKSNSPYSIPSGIAGELGSSSDNDGGDLCFIGGDAYTNPSTRIQTGIGGNIEIIGGGGAAAGLVKVQGGSPGGALWLYGGDSSAAGDFGGSVSIQGGDGRGAGGGVSIDGGRGEFGGDGGPVTISGGLGFTGGGDGGDVIIQGGYANGATGTAGKVSILTNAVSQGGRSSAWHFNINGRTTFPTATAPANSYGVTGDTAGMVAFDSNYIYYCTADYVDNSTDIWRRTAHGTGTW